MVKNYGAGGTKKRSSTTDTEKLVSVREIWMGDRKEYAVYSVRQVCSQVLA